MFLVLAMAIVWVAEAVNTAIEFLSNAVTEEHNLLIKKAKDTAAASVLLAALAAVIIGLLVFLPYLT